MANGNGDVAAPQQQPQDAFEATGPLGIHLKGTGPIGMLALLIVCGFAGIVAVLYYHHQDVKSDAQHLESSMSEMVFVMSLSDEERKKLRLSMPDSLRSKLRRGREND